MKDNHGNPFLALADALWARGEDGEQIARDLAIAFCKVARESNNGNNINQEFLRLAKDSWEEEWHFQTYRGKRERE